MDGQRSDHVLVDEWRSEYWWERPVVATERQREFAEREVAQRRSIGEEFGIPNPEKIQAHVDAICASRFKE
ncbi:hypothetical protein KHO57_gp142 [Mycobacterium phage Phabba]|uniref:Uncharacterized protein n=1 Tax=Mycobacterium phage Phabba TaxID=2027899 RepID=A0A249XSN6_9CAUD|nr:hypothetical protein KHO57_gp142 [Mycobacterium phage Phabba]ASZ74762.1 hypothetical protein SEA_PHABBA_225 [Mycobacterium phage Phabba]